MTKALLTLTVLLLAFPLYAESRGQGYLGMATPLSGLFANGGGS